MKCAADFRKIARNALKGKWPVAVLTGFLASLMGAQTFSGGGGSSGSSNGSTLFDAVDAQQLPKLLNMLYIVLAALIVWLLIMLFISGAGKLGYAIFNMKLVDGEEVRVSDLFSQFHRFTDGLVMNLLMAIYTLLWSLLLVIPGIVKSFSYAMTPYILAEHPEMTANEAITESRRIMDGNKFRLFCLGLSFIGWRLLCILPSLIPTTILFIRLSVTGNVALLFWMIPCMIPVFIGLLFLNPYQEAAIAAFYRDVTAPKAAAMPNGEGWVEGWTP